MSAYNTSDLPQRRSLRPHYNTIDGKFGSQPLKPYKREKVDHVQQKKNKLCVMLRSQFDPAIHSETNASTYANNMYNNMILVDCLTNTDRRMETRKDIDDMVLRYSANRATIPSHVSKDDIYEIKSPYKSSLCTKESEFVYGYGYYVQKLTDYSGLRIIERDILANGYEGGYIDAHNACYYRSDFMEYYSDEFSYEEYQEQVALESKHLEEFLRQEKEIEKDKLREKAWLDLEIDSYDESDTYSVSSPIESEKQMNNNDECIVIICEN
jgi:hypothetical protein